MDELVGGGSVLAAFFAGGVALFAPCCIVFLLPSYLAASVKNRRWRLLPLTFVFAVGLAAVLVPVTLGVGLLAAFLTEYHTWLYTAGGVLLFVLAGLALSGRTWGLPSFLRAPDPGRGDSAGVFALGLLSGVASSCCAPVLAGVMALSAVSPGPLDAGLLGVAYVFGMTFPLFVLALLWDRWRLGERRLFAARSLRLRVGGRIVDTDAVNVAVAGVFGVMGLMVVGLAVSGDTATAPGAQLAIGRALSAAFDRALAWAEPVPEPVLGMGLLALAVGLVIAGRRDRQPRRRRCCHDDDTQGASADVTAKAR